MTILELVSWGEGASAVRSLVTLVLIACVFVSIGSGLTSAKAVSQRSAKAAPVKPGIATSTRLAKLHGKVEVRTGGGQWSLAKSGQTLKRGSRFALSLSENKPGSIQEVHSWTAPGD